MKKRGFISATIFCLASLGFLPQCAHRDVKPKQNRFELWPHSVKTLQNGLSIHYFPDRSLPYLDLLLVFSTGSSIDPKGREGLSNLTVQMLNKGTRKKSSRVLSEEIEFIGASYSSSTNVDFLSIQMNGLSSTKAQMLDLFSDIALTPSFPTDEIERQRRQMLVRIEGIKDSPSALSNAIFGRWLYEGHPYENPEHGYLKSVKAIRKKDIIQHYLRYFRPNNASLAVVGDFDQAFQEKVEQTFSGWTQRDIIAPQEVPLPPYESRHIRILAKKDLKQSSIYLGHKGVERKHPDFLTLQLANIILGGSFASRLNQEIREKRGLTYSIGSSFQADRQMGAFFVSTDCAHEKVNETLREVLVQLDLFKKKGPTDLEVSNAKNLLKGQFSRTFATAGSFAGVVLGLEVMGLGTEYIKNYLAKVDAIQTSEVHRVIKEFLKPEALKIFIYSNESQSLENQIRDLGEVSILSEANVQL